MNIQQYWKAVLSQNKNQLRTFFHPHAVIRWHCTNECFSVENFLTANCEYPEKWDGTFQELHQTGNLIVCALNVYSTTASLSFYVTSFIRLKDEKIISVDEYWSDNSPAPQWRQAKNLSTPIR